MDDFTCAEPECVTRIAKPPRGRPAKFCPDHAADARRAAKAAYARDYYSRTDKPQCAEDGCERYVKSRGLCATHYNSTHAANRHKKVELNCDGCGKSVLKESRTRRYETIQCNDWLCRTWLTWGVAKSSDLPKDHWAIMIGSTCEWPQPPMLKTHEPKPKMDFTCQWCGEGFQSHQPHARYCGKKCMDRRARKIRRAREHNAPGYFTWTEVTRLWLLFDKSCAYCSVHLALGDVQAEHVQPLSKQGRNDIGNILPSCSACNSDKSAMLLPEWAAFRAKRGLPPVKTTWVRSDARYKHLVPHALPLAA